VDHTRIMLRNGIVVRAGRVRADSQTHVRITFVSRADSARMAAVGALLGGARVVLSRGAATTVNVAGPRPPRKLVGLVEGRIALLERLAPERAAPIVPGEDRVADPANAQVDILARLAGPPRGHPDRRALELLNYIVGVPSYGGRLGWALTKAGLTYAVAANTTFGATAGQIAITTTCNPANTDATIQAIREIVSGVGDRGVEEWELREAQAFMLGRQLLYGARDDATAEALAWALAESELGGVERLDLPAFSRAYLSVTLADVNRAARTWYRADRLEIRATGSVPAPAQRIFPDGTFRALFEPER